MKSQIESLPQTVSWRLILPAFCASLVTIGLARFAYTPLLPALVAGGWFKADNAAYLGAANLAGYLAGVLGGATAGRRFNATLLLRGAMVLATISLFACAWPLGFNWFFVWRLLSGIAGGATMVLAAPHILPHMHPSRHGFVSGAIFMGIGLGVTLSGTLIPLLLQLGLVPTWLGLGLLSGAFTLAGWKGWMPAISSSPLPHDRQHGHFPRLQLRALYAIYALNAFALVPHMVFLVDFVARGLGQGVESGTVYWVLFGIGAIAGPILSGRIADRWGYRATLLMALVLELIFIGLPALRLGSAALIASSLVVGASTIGIVPVVLGRTRQILAHHPFAQPAAWRTATAGFAVLQAGGAYLLTFIFDRSDGDYNLLFISGAAAIAIALAINVIVPDKA